jgi:hypothetical protein
MMIARPIRIQLSRRKGFNLQLVSRAANGLAAINCARPTKHGNPYRVGCDGTATECVEQYRYEWEMRLRGPVMGMVARAQLDELRGRNLACWCKHGDPCHADVLLELANR